jgi:hypothetical protein
MLACGRPENKIVASKNAHVDTFLNNFIFLEFINIRFCGPMDKALVYGARDSRFDPWQDRNKCQREIGNFNFLNYKFS